MYIVNMSISDEIMLFELGLAWIVLNYVSLNYQQGHYLNIYFWHKIVWTKMMLLKLEVVWIVLNYVCIN